MEIEPPRYETHIAQDEDEINSFVELLQNEQVRSYLEVGARYGGSFWRIARSMPKGSRVVAIDMPSGMGGKPDAIDHLRACTKELCRVGYDAHLIEGDSHRKDTVKLAMELSPYDCVFLDGDHTMDGVTKDWQNYGPLARMVAFHDISCSNTQKPIRVLQFWEEIKTGYRHHEIKAHHTGRHNGIGVLWR